MERKKFFLLLKYLPVIIGVSVIFGGLLIYPKETANGVKMGIALLLENIIPALFPFMVLSTYIINAPFTEAISCVLEKPTQLIFKMNSNCFTTFILGALGGYPIGAKITAELFSEKRITQNEAQRLMYWCINPSLAFTVTSVGCFMLNNVKSGIIIYTSILLSSLIIGFIQRFLSDGKILENHAHKINSKNVFIKSVSTGSEAMLSVCSWVLTFSSISSLIDIFLKNQNISLFVKSILEVTTGCKTCISEGLSLPIITSILGFGGLAVIFQVSPYLEECNVSLKNFICWRLVESSISALICSWIIKLIPQNIGVYKVLEVNNNYFSLTNNLMTALLLIFMCILLILEVDNKKKIC